MPKAERVLFSVDVASLVDIRLAPGFSFHDAAASSEGSIAQSPAVVEDDAMAAHSCAHDAGADAYMTGVAFLRMAALIESDAKTVALAALATPPSEVVSAAVSASEVVSASTPSASSSSTSRPAPRPLALQRVHASALHRAIQLSCLEVSTPLVQSSPDSAGAPPPTPIPPLTRLSDSLFLMRVAAPDHRVLRLRDARALAKAGLVRASRPQQDLLPGNSVLAARLSAATTGNALVHVSRMTPGVSALSLQALIADALGISKNLVDK